MHHTDNMGKCSVLLAISKWSKSVEGWTLHTLNSHYLDDITIAMSQTFRLCSKFQSSSKVLRANVSIREPANLLPATSRHFNQVLMLWHMFGSYATYCHLYRRKFFSIRFAVRGLTSCKYTENAAANVSVCSVS